MLFQKIIKIQKNIFFIITIVIALQFFLFLFPKTYATEILTINITDQEVGIIPKLTWGINLGWNTKNNTLNDGIPKSKATLARIDTNMENIFQNSTSANFYSLDLKINATKMIGIEPLLIVSYMPNWLAGNQYNRTRSSPPNNMSQWLGLVKLLVDHVKDDVKYYEIWNEPDARGYFWEGNEIDYRELLINTSKVIKENDPDSKILAPASYSFYDFLRYYTNGETWQKSWIYMNEICKNASDAFDIISFHGYEFPLDTWPDGLNLYEQKINELGCNNKSFWFTEGGLLNHYKNDYSDVLQVAKWRKILLDAGMEAQIYYPFTEDKGQLYDDVNKTFTPTGKYYQLMGTLQFWGSRLDIINNTPDNISAISSIAVKNPNGETLVQLTSNLNESKDVQLGFPSYSNVTIYESSANQIFDYPADINETINLSLTLKPYSVYILRAIETPEPIVFTSTTTLITSTTTSTSTAISTSTIITNTNVTSTTTTIIISTNQTTIPSINQTIQTTTVINQNSNEKLGITNNLKTLAIFASFTLTIIIIGIFPISMYLEKKQPEQINYEEKQHPEEEVFEEQPKPVIIREIIERIPEQTEEPVKEPEEKKEPTKIEEIEEKIQPVKQPEKTEYEIIEETIKSLSEKIARLKSKMHETMKEVESEENN